MNDTWPARQLRDIADVRISNVDKKVYPSEKPVKLCNYMDAYTHEYITGRIQFMEGSATPAEIERFSLNSGDVIITKDSETPDDIGIPTVVLEQITDLVCGYHLALIRPNAEQLDSIYLAKQLSTSRVARYFSLHASGSTRYGLPVPAIEAVEIPTPPKPEQAKIAEILSTVDRAIEQTEALIAKQQRIKTGLMQDLLTRGIDEHGNLRSERTHKFKDSPLGRIPAEWTVTTLGNIGTWSSGGTPSKANPEFWSGDIPWVSPKDMKAFDLEDTVDKITTSAARFGSTILPENTILLVIRGMILDHNFPVCCTTRPMAFNQDVKAITARPGVVARYAAYWLATNEQAILKIVTTATHGTKRLDMNDLYGVDIALPEEVEQCRIVQSLDEYQRQALLTKVQAEKFLSLKTALMQDLLSGKKRVTALLNGSEARTI